jgi:hypothetical protein
LSILRSKEGADGLSSVMFTDDSPAKHCPDQGVP